MKVYVSRVADKYIYRLSTVDRERIDAAIVKLSKEPPEGDIAPVKGQPGLYRTRVGDFRMLWHFENNAYIVITHIEPRGQIYKKHKGKI